MFCILMLLFFIASCNSLREISKINATSRASVSLNQYKHTNNSWLHDIYLLNQKPLVPDKYTCSNLSTVELKNYCFKRLGISSGNPSFCSEISINSLKEKCYLNITLSKGTFQACDEFPGYYPKRNCYYELIKANKNASFCQTLKTSPYPSFSVDFMPICLAKVVKTTMNESLCDEVGNWKNDCFNDIALGSNDVRDCVKITDVVLTDICIKAIAVNTKDLKLCNMIQQNYSGFCDFRCECRNSVFARLSIENHDFSYCDKIMDDYKELPVLKERCYIDSAASTMELESCNLIPENAKDRCRYSIIRKIKKPELCKTIKDPGTHDGCYTDILHSLNKSEFFNSNFCDNIIQTYKKKDCYHWAAIHNKEPSICGKFSDKKDINRCLSDLAIYSRNISFCKNILDVNESSLCLINSIESSDGIAACNKVENWARNACISKVAQDVETCASISNDTTYDLENYQAENYQACVMGIARRLVYGNDSYTDI